MNKIDIKGFLPLPLSLSCDLKIILIICKQYVICKYIVKCLTESLIKIAGLVTCLSQGLGGEIRAAITLLSISF